MFDHLQQYWKMDSGVKDSSDWKLFGIVAIVLVIFYSAIMFVLSDSEADRKLRLNKKD